MKNPSYFGLTNDGGRYEVHAKQAIVELSNQAPIKLIDIDGDLTQAVKKNPDRYVIKPSGEAQNVKRRLFVGEEEDGDDVIRMLEAYKRAFSDEIKVFQLQRRVNGVEVAVGAFFNGKRFITPVNINFEHKKLFPGEVGPPTGEMGTAMFWSEPNRCSTTRSSKWSPSSPKKATSATSTSTASSTTTASIRWNSPPASAIPPSASSKKACSRPSAISSGSSPPAASPNGAPAAASRSACASSFRRSPSTTKPPSNPSPRTAPSSSRSRTPTAVHIEDVKQVNGQWLIAGTSGVVLVVVGTGQTMKQAQAQVYSRIKNILIPNMYYRTDIGDRWVEDSDKLHNWGYLR